MKEWEKEHPNWLNNEQESEQYMKMLHNLMGGENEEEQGKNAREIMKNIGGVVMIKHAMDSIMSGESELSDDDEV
jgi:NAD(P)H-hydrate repair Nnr-like enzyme with NAD(P)H-hydrate dehydratase domain